MTYGCDNLTFAMYETPKVHMHCTWKCHFSAWSSGFGKFFFVHVSLHTKRCLQGKCEQTFSTYFELDSLPESTKTSEQRCVTSKFIFFHCNQILTYLKLVKYLVKSGKSSNDILPPNSVYLGVFPYSAEVLATHVQWRLLFLKTVRSFIMFLKDTPS